MSGLKTIYISLRLFLKTKSTNRCWEDVDTNAWKTSVSLSPRKLPLGASVFSISARHKGCDFNEHKPPFKEISQ